MTPPSIEAVRRDDALLDQLAERTLGRDAGASDGDPALFLLAALADDVDTDLPTGVDLVAVQALTAGLAAAAQEAPDVRRPSGRPLRAVPRARRVLAVRRGAAVVAGAVMVLASAGVAAAVTGDPAGAFGLRAIVAAVSRQPHHPTPPASAVQRLRARIAATAQRVPAVTPGEVQALIAEAQRLPDGGGPDVRSELASLRSLVAQASAGVTTAATPPASGVPASGAPGASGGPGGSGASGASGASGGHGSAHTSHGQASGHAKVSPHGKASGHGHASSTSTTASTSATSTSASSTATTSSGTTTTSGAAAASSAPGSSGKGAGRSTGKASGRPAVTGAPPSGGGGPSHGGGSSGAVAPR